jgi:hypothetical protein
MERLIARRAEERVGVTEDKEAVDARAADRGTVEDEPISRIG